MIDPHDEVAQSDVASKPRRRDRDYALLATAGATFLVAMVAMFTSWVLSPIEIVRHAMPASLVVRLSLWLAISALLDAVVRDRRVVTQTVGD